MPRTKLKTNKIIQKLAAMELTLFSLGLLMALVTFCTFDQVNIGTFNAVDKYFRDFFVWTSFSPDGFKFPIFPGGGFVGLLLLINLSAASITRFSLQRKKVGVWLIHVGLVVLVLGEFITGIFAIESQMALDEGATLNYSESARVDELVIIDTSHPEYDQVHSIDSRKLKEGRHFQHPDLPFSLHINTYYPNADVRMKDASRPSIPNAVNKGMGLQVDILEMPEVSKDDQRNLRSAFVELKDKGKSLGIWLVSSALSRPEAVEHDGKKFEMAMRPKRYYKTYSMTLLDFKHDVYPGTTIPKNFSSQVRLIDPPHDEDRNVLIYMNNPLRYRGDTFYQASFGKNDTLSILQVVTNPGRHLPYISFVLMSVGLLVHFLLMFGQFRRKNKK